MNLEFTLSVANSYSRAFQGREVGLKAGRYSPVAIAQMHTLAVQYVVGSPPDPAKPSAAEDFWQIVLECQTHPSLPWTSKFVAEPNQVQLLQTTTYTTIADDPGTMEDEHEEGQSVIVDPSAPAIGDLPASHTTRPILPLAPRYVWRTSGLQALSLASDARYRFHLERVPSASASLQLSDIGMGTFMVGVAA